MHLILIALKLTKEKPIFFKLKSTFNLFLSKPIKTMHTSIWLVYSINRIKKYMLEIIPLIVGTRKHEYELLKQA